MARSNINKKLWELRINSVVAYDKWISEEAIKATKDKISGYGENGVLMNERAMQQTINVIEQARKTNNDIASYGRSNPVAKEEEEEEESNDELIMSGALGGFSRSVCTSNVDGESDTAASRIDRSIKKEKKNISNSSKAFYFEQIETLEKFMGDNNINASFKCRSKKITKKQIKKMEVDAKRFNGIDLKNVLSQIKNMSNSKLFDYCDKKPYQCLVCPYYYKSFKEFYVMKTMRKEKRNEE